MRIGIYNRFLGTLGGAERYMLTMAYLLSRVADVEVVSQCAMTPELVRDRLAIDITGINLVQLPDAAVETAEEVSEGYDLFINSSHCDPVASRAPRSVLLLYFPTVPDLNVLRPARRAVNERLLRPLLSLPLLASGFDQAEHMSDGRRFWWTHGAGTIKVPPFFRRRPRLVVPLASFRHDGTGPTVRFLSNDKEIKTVQVPPGTEFTDYTTKPHIGPDGLCNLTLLSDTFRAPPEFADPRDLGVAVGPIRPGPLKSSLYRLACKRLALDLDTMLYPAATPAPPTYARSYTTIWTISNFVRQWTLKYWNTDSSILTPPVDVQTIQAYGQVPKENLILSVGRFFQGHHNKKHLEMITAFSEMLRQGLTDWSLVLAGGVPDDPVHLDYLERVRTAAKGLPVRIAADIPFAELLDLYARSAIYWHATGHGEVEHLNPAAMEHFGITTVEAMAAGCVPVVINRAGQREIVRQNQDGFLWNDLPALTAHTWRLIAAPDLRARMAASARARSRAFSSETFDHRLACLLGHLGAAGSPAWRERASDA